MKPRIHCLKTWPEPFEAIVSGRKRFEYRKDDRGFAVGDVLALYYWDPSPLHAFPHLTVGYSPARWTACSVTYVLRGFGLPEGYVCMSIEPLLEPPHVPHPSSDHYNSDSFEAAGQK